MLGSLVKRGDSTREGGEEKLVFSGMKAFRFGRDRFLGSVTGRQETGKLKERKEGQRSAVARPRIHSCPHITVCLQQTFSFQQGIRSANAGSAINPQPFPPRLLLLEVNHQFSSLGKHHLLLEGSGEKYLYVTINPTWCLTNLQSPFLQDKRVIEACEV